MINVAGAIAAQFAIDHRARSSHLANFYLEISGLAG